jgi:putative sterol carrier protein
MASLEEITDRFRQAVGSDSGLGKTVKFNLKGEGVVYVDHTAVSNDDKPADLTMTLSKDDLEEIGQGRLDPVMAVMTGRLQLSDPGLAMQLQPKMQALFSRVR